MKFFKVLLVFLVFSFFSVTTSSAQILESDFVKEKDILGVDVMEEVLQEVDTLEKRREPSKTKWVDTLALTGGVVLIALFAYIVYSKREK